MNPTKSQREAILTKIEDAVSKQYYDPEFDEASWKQIVASSREEIVTASNSHAFESAITAMLTKLAPRGLGLLSKDTAINSRNAINASFAVRTIDGQLRWIFQDVLPGGVAARAGALAGDVLLVIDGKSMTPAGVSGEQPPFEMNAVTPLEVLRGADQKQTVRFSLQTGGPKYKDNPYSEPTALTATRDLNGSAYLKASLFPGKIGIDFANELDSLFATTLKDTARLILDLRGNPGGGIGGLTLMSYLTPERLPIGYSKNRKMAAANVHPSTLPVFDKIPRSKLAIPGLAIKFFGKNSVFLYTEALGDRAYRGKTAILVNEHTTGAAEMVAQFAQENGLAIIVGTKTPGRLVSRSAAKLGHGYRLVLPVAAYISAKGTQIEGKGINPNIDVQWSYDDAVKGRDTQLYAASAALQT